MQQLMSTHPSTHDRKSRWMLCNSHKHCCSVYLLIQLPRQDIFVAPQKLAKILTSQLQLDVSQIMYSKINPSVSSLMTHKFKTSFQSVFNLNICLSRVNYLHWLSSCVDVEFGEIFFCSVPQKPDLVSLCKVWVTAQQVGWGWLPQKPALLNL